MARANKADRLEPELRRLMGILIIGTSAALLDTTVVNVAIDSIKKSMDVPVSTIQWVNTGYLLALGMVIPLSAWAVGRFGAKRMWLFSLAAFLLGSVLSGAAWNIDSLITFRVLQGVGGGLLVPIMQTLLVQAAGAQRIGRVMAVVGMPAMVVPILGPFVGGLILSNLSWRWIFYINVPICLIAMVLAWRGLPDSTARAGKPLDVRGLLLLSPALAALLFGLSQVGAHGFGQVQVVGPLVIGTALLAVFVGHALRTAGPVVDVRLFAIRSFTGSGILLFVSGLSLYGVLMLLPLYYQQVGEYSALVTGLLLVPQGIGGLLTRGAAGRLTDRVGPRPVVVAGMLLTAVGTLPYALGQAHPNNLLLGVCLVVRGAGLGAATVSVMAAAFQGMQPALIPHASSATRILQQVGGSFGTALLAVVLQSQLAHHPDDTAGRAAAFGATFLWTIGFALLSLGPVLLLPRRPWRKAAADAPVEPTAAVGAPGAK
ncbi:DHA2 family efflux MFS transporter permease subunit [Kitasatospora aureofaciens]|uniref:DHA2 family efflux MFS transporter permease subunit n=1 Tax=Kitasatospora aureofaciens TaxID=1894 RepID=UPI0037C677BD